jgi:hypothetical protein
MSCEGNRSCCGCERAFVTAYLALRDLGTSRLYAVQACTTLYRIHHPPALRSDARRWVEEWIDRGTGNQGEARQAGKAR